MSVSERNAVVFLVVTMILSRQIDASVDCRKFAFAPNCRGIVAKRYPVDNYLIPAGARKDLAEIHFREGSRLETQRSPFEDLLPGRTLDNVRSPLIWFPIFPKSKSNYFPLNNHNYRQYLKSGVDEKQA